MDKKQLLKLVVLNALVSYGVAHLVHYFPLGYAPTPREFIWASNSNNAAITKYSGSLGEVIKRMNEIAPPKKGEEPLALPE